MTHELIDSLGAALEVAGVVLLIGGLLLAFARSVIPTIAVRPELVEGSAAASTSSARTGSGSGQTGGSTRAVQGNDRYLRLRHDIGRAILLGLEVLVAADIVRSVTLAPTMSGLTVLATLVVIRTFLSWSLALELDGRWPWQRPPPTPAPHLEKTP
jgi:Protein of unknown function (DUF1622)